MTGQQRVIKVVMTAVVFALALGVAPIQAAHASPTHSSADYSSFFGDGELRGAGWATCAPITWSADTRGLTSAQARREIARLRDAWRLWADAAGVKAIFTGRQALAYDPASYGLVPSDGSSPVEHHVYIAFKARKQVPILTGGAVGLAKPTLVLVEERRIVGGIAIFMRRYAIEQARSNPSALAHVYAHELGHVLGLGHAVSRANVMYPEVQSVANLGDGDASGIARITQECAAV
jgi:hypothetical protein